MEKFDVSIVIPIYNKEKYLELALQSILNQQAVRIEIICIDDGSEDDSYNIAYKILANYSNVVWIKNNFNIGVAESRNKGIRIARGEYIGFFDADDLYPNENVLSWMYNIAHKESADIVGGSFSDFTQETETVKFDGELFGYSFENDGWILWRDYQFEYGFTRFLYKKDFLKKNNIFFPNLVRFQDPPFLVNALHKAGKFYAINKVVYKYRLPENGIQWNEKKICDSIRGICLNLQFAVKNKYWKLYNLSLCRLIRLLNSELIKEETKRNYKIRSAMSQIRDVIQSGIKYAILSNEDINAVENLLNLYCREKPLVTIVVPAYNMEKYIRQCLDSLVGQTNQNFNIIVVNDGSTDNTGEICEKYVNLYPDIIKYVYQTNKGLGAARNTGLQLVTTKYVSFLDSDDWQDVRFIEKFNNLLFKLDFEPDLVFTLPKCYNEASKRIEDWMDTQKYISIFYEINNYDKQTLNIANCPELYQLEVNANRKIYRTVFLRETDFSFPEGVKWEDIRPHIQLLHLAKSCVSLPDTGFIYRTNNVGQVTLAQGIERLDIINVFDDTLSFIRDGDYSAIELAYIMWIFCTYTHWMIEMTDMDNVHALLEGLHRVYTELPKEMVDAYYAYNWRDIDELNKFKGLISCLSSKDFGRLSDYINRQNLYRYWMLHCGKRKNIIGGGIQCIKDSGLKYTINLFFRKIIYQGFK